MKDKLTEFFRQAAFYRYHPKFQRRERDYKLRLASGFSRSRYLLSSKSVASLELLRRTFTSKDNNIVDWRDRADIVNWIKRRPTDVLASLRILWKSNRPLENRFASFCHDLDRAGVTASGSQLAVASTLMMTLSACDFPPVKVEAFRRSLQVLDWDDLSVKKSALERYLYAQTFLDYIIRQGKKFDVQLRDRLDAQGIVWCIGGGWSDTPVPRSWRNDPEQRAKAELALYQGDLKELNAEAGASKRTPTEKLALVKARRGQGRFRDGLIELWGSCAVSDCKELDLLRASHIMPWRDSTDIQRLDKYNGLLLSPNLDAAFDAGLITFGADRRIIISKSLKHGDRRALGIQTQFLLSTISPRHLSYLAYHRRNVFEKKRRTFT